MSAPVALHIAETTPQRQRPQSLRRRAWWFLANLIGMAMALSVIPVGILLGGAVLMKLALEGLR